MNESIRISSLSDLIAQIESNGNAYAVRYEPNYHPRTETLTEMMRLCKCSFDTARVLCSMSWGLYQIMGDNLIHLGLMITPFEYLESPEIQREYFDAYCEADHLHITLDDVLHDAGKRALFARLYNGPGNISGYCQRMIDVAKANGLTVS